MRTILNKTKTNKKIPIRNGEEFLRLMKSATTKKARKLCTQIYNDFLAKRQKEVIANGFY